MISISLRVSFWFQLGDLVHEVKKSLGQAFNCKCCYDKIDVEVGTEEKPVVSEAIKEEEEAEEKAPIKVEEPSAPIVKLHSCPVCPEAQNVEDDWKFGLHMAKHFEKELVEHIEINAAVNRCRKCDNFKTDNLTAAMLHVGFEHGEFDR